MVGRVGRDGLNRVNDRAGPVTNEGRYCRYLAGPGTGQAEAMGVRSLCEKHAILSCGREKKGTSWDNRAETRAPTTFVGDIAPKAGPRITMTLPFSAMSGRVLVALLVMRSVSAATRDGIACSQGGLRKTAPWARRRDSAWSSRVNGSTSLVVPDRPYPLSGLGHFPPTPPPIDPR